jgi:hypothetical protein
MHTLFKRHQKVKLRVDPREEDIEWYVEKPVSLKKGTTGFINILLPNGRYHVRVEDNEGNELAYVAMDEEQLEPA